MLQDALTLDFEGEQASLALELLESRRRFRNGLKHPVFLKQRAQAIYEKCGELNK